MSDLTDKMGQLAVSDRPGLGKQVVDSPEPPPLLDLSADERAVYDYICLRLREAGIEHVTAGMPIAIIVRTYKQWLDALQRCETEGRTQKAQSGWHSPTPWAEDEKRLKMELGQWLPKACLTIPSLARVRKETGAGAGQDDLFADLVQHATASPNRGLPN
ncbi:UNVERIFIED_ORG: P27 family phage terminase small subunit [Shinella sp. XGS7]|nr:P27 family phage terminase small subunit [Shinella sp. XGS7]